jgi:hypothetical protein
MPDIDSSRRLGDEFSGLLSAIATTDAVHPLAEATMGVFRDSEQLRKVLDANSKVDPAILQGRALEFLEILKFNRAAAEAGSSLQASATHFTDPQAAADILIRDGETVIKEVQAKSYGRAADAARVLSEEKYQGMDRLVPSDKSNDILALLERHERRYGIDSPRAEGLADVNQHLTGELHADGISSGGTTRNQAEFAARHPQIAELQLRGAAVLQEVGQAGLVGATVGGSLQGAFSAIHQGMRLSQGETTATEAIVVTIQATASGASRGGAVAAGSRLIAITANEVGVGRLVGEIGPGAMANAIFEAGLSTYRFAHGEIDHKTYQQELGGAALRATASTYCGMAGQLLIPVPVVGAAVGAISGYVAAAVLVESGVLGLGSTNIVTIAEDRQATIERECAAAILEMRRCQEELQQLEESYGQVFRQTFSTLLDELKEHQHAGLHRNSMERLVRLGEALGHALPWSSLEEFDAFMLNDELELVL